VISGAFIIIGGLIAGGFCGNTTVTAALAQFVNEKKLIAKTIK
jgi:predicted PilT family ATPase